jgi:hypothetical protein
VARPKSAPPTHRLAGRTVLDAAGNVIGSAVGLYAESSAQPVEFVATRVSHRGRRRIVLVPLADATVGSVDIRVQAGQRLAAQSPPLPAKHPLCCDEERGIYTHYGLSYPIDATATRLHAEDGTLGG